MKRTPDLEVTTWRKSSYSGGGADDCPEVADGHPTVVPVRDSKLPTAPTRSAFVTHLKH